MVAAVGFTVGKASKLQLKKSYSWKSIQATVGEA